MANSGLFKPSVGGGNLGQKKREDGQFVNPPAYPETSGFSGPASTGGKNNQSLQKTPSAKTGRV